MRAPDSGSCPEEASASEPAQEGFWFLWDVLSVWPWRAFLSSWSVLSCLSGPGGLSCLVCLALEGCPVVSVWPWRAVLSCFVLSCLFSPGGLLIPPHFHREFFWGVVRVPAVGAEAKGPEDHLPWPPELPAPPWSPELPAPPWSPELPAPPWSPSVLLWRSPSCVPVCVCPEGPPEHPPPLPDGTVKARDEPFGRRELCQSSVVCVMCPHLMFPYLVCFLSLFNVIIS